ncbi:diguanylate cyclase domain-containing protein [Sporosarcina sp. YIM B06819]|uniref:diguanylate cyclase domain-containing protein n=1 Tax=Sporosarcina sp. YIM B06819 TaxID=3081769 RepID=UPI00298CAD28|nr:diguanylate cyclase [Sporosarcina sp. YIM B06819]
MIDNSILPFDTTLLEVLEDMVFISKVEQDSTFTYAYFNHLAIQHANVNRDAIGKTFSETHDLELSTFLYNQYSKVLQTKELLIYEDSYLSSLGVRKYSNTRLTPLFDLTGTCTYIIGVVKDITTEKLAQLDSEISWNKLVESEKQFRIIAENAQDVIALINEKLAYTYVSPSSNEVYGFDSFEYIGKSAIWHVHPEDISRLEQGFIEVLLGAKTSSLRLRIKHKVDGWLWSELKVTPVNDKWNNFKHMVMIIRDVTLQKKNEDQLEYFAYHDFLTELPNRRLFTDRLQTKLDHFRDSGKGFAVCLLDIDHFKNINDQFGHEVGDCVIREFGKRLSGNIGKDAMAARLGGDEFVLLLPNVGTEELAQKTAMAVKSAMKEPWSMRHKMLHVTTSMGISLVSSTEATVTSVLKDADDAMYEAKKSGRNCFHIIHSS